MVIIENRLITRPGQLTAQGSNAADGIGFCADTEVLVRNCVVDFSNLDLEEQDEAASMTWGAHGIFENCTLRGAVKLFLCGSGDAHKADVENGRRVTLRGCTLEHFGRRGPEVQAGMEVRLENCVIRNWGEPDLFTSRIFGAWAHNGGRITAINCRFEQAAFWRGWRVMLADLCGHIGQAWNDEGVRGLLRWKTYLPGVCRGLTAGPGGTVTAYGCTKNRWWIRIENNTGD